MAALECLEARKGDCRGAVELRESLTGTGTAIARCDHHWTERLRMQKRHNRRYPDSPLAPVGFDPTYAGETWDEGEW